MRMAKGSPIKDVRADFIPEEPDGTPSYNGPDLPVFCESFLYPTVGKGDARFILGVGDEYEHILQALGTKAFQRILDVKPRLAQRLGLAKVVEDCLEDAISHDQEYREKHFPDVTLSHEDASAVWQMLHDEYRRLYNPERAMERDQLRLYHKLTDALGSYEQGQRQKEIDRLPEKLEKQQKKREELAAKKKVVTNTKVKPKARKSTNETSS